MYLPNIDELREKTSVHLCLGGEPSMSKEYIQQHLKEAFSELSKRKDLKEFSVNFIDTASENLFFETISLQDWQNVLKVNSLQYCAIARYFSKQREQNSTRIYADGKLASKDHNAFMDKQAKADSNNWWTKFAFLDTNPKTDQWTTQIAPPCGVLQRLYPDEIESTTETYEQIFRSIMFTLVFDEEERSRMQNKSTEEQDVYIVDKVFNKLQNDNKYLIWKKNTKGEQYLNDQELLVGDMPPKLLQMLFDKVLAHQPDILKDWCNSLRQDHPNRAITLNLSYAISEQLYAGKKVPIETIEFNNYDENIASFLWNLPSRTEGRGTISVRYTEEYAGKILDGYGHKSDFWKVMQEIADAQVNDQSSPYLVFDLHTNLLLDKLSYDQQELLLQIRRNAAYKTRKRNILEHKEQCEGQNFINRVASSLPLKPIAQAVIHNGEKPRSKTKSNSKTLKIEQHLQANVAEQATLQQVTVTQLQQRIMALQNRQQEQQQERVNMPTDSGKILRREDVYNYANANFYNMPQKCDIMRLWDTVTATVSKKGNPSERIHCISEAAFRVICENAYQFQGGLEHHAQANYLPKGFYIKDNPDNNEKTLCYSARFALQGGSNSIPALRHQILLADEAPPVPLDLLESNPIIKNICAECLNNDVKNAGHGYYDGDRMTRVYEIRDILAKKVHLLIAAGDNVLKTLLEEIKKSEKMKWQECVDKALSSIDVTKLKETYWQKEISATLSAEQKEFLSDFTSKEWMGLETIFFKLDTFGIQQFLTTLASLKAARPECYEHFRRNFLASSQNWAKLLTPGFAKQIQTLSNMPLGDLQLWQTLVNQHQEQAKVLDFPKMMDAFIGFTDAIKTIEPGLSIPQACAVLDANNFFTSLSRLLTIVKNALNPQEQLDNLSGLSLSAVGAVFPMRYEGFHAARHTMNLTPQNTVIEPTLAYVASEKDLFDRVVDSNKSLLDLQTLLHRYIAKVDYALDFKYYERLYNTLEHAEGYSLLDKKLVFALCFLTTSGIRQVNGIINEATFHESVLPLLDICAKLNPADKIKLIPIPSVFLPRPTLLELQKLLSLKDSSNLQKNIESMEALLKEYGVIAWEHLLSKDINSLEDLQKRLSSLNCDKSKQFLSQLDILLADFNPDEKQCLQTLIQFIRGEDVVDKGAALINAAKQYKEKQALNSLLPILIDGARRKVINIKYAVNLLQGLITHTVPINLIAVFLKLLKKEIESDVIDQLDFIAQQLPSKQQQIAATQCLCHLLDAKVEHSKEVLQFFVLALQQGYISPLQIKYILETLTQKTLDALLPVYINEELQPALYKVLAQFPTVLNKIVAFKGNLGLFLQIMQTQKVAPSEKETEDLCTLLSRMDDASCAKLLTFYQRAPYPPVRYLVEIYKPGQEIEKVLTQLDKRPYGERDLKKNYKQLFQELSHFANRFPDKPIDEEVRKKMLKRMDALQSFANIYQNETTAELEKKIQWLSTKNSYTTEDKLRLVALLREYASRTVPGKNLKGLFANTAQMLAVLDAVFHEGNLGLQVATGEGKTLIIALLSSYKTLTSKKAVDLLTSNTTLAARDLEGFQQFYAGCKIRTALIGPKSPYNDYIQGKYGINISDFGSMALFQGKYLYEGVLEKIDNELMIDEGDDPLLDKRTQFNHPKQLKGDSSQSSATSSPVAWMYPYLMEFIETPSFKAGKSRQEDVMNAIRYLQEKGDVDPDDLAKLAKEIDVWIDAALTVRDNLEKNINYRIVDETRIIDGEEKKVRYARIVTDGRIDYEAQLGDGVQQLLHAKLNAEATRMGEEPNFVIDPEQDIVHSSTAKNIIRRYPHFISLTATPGSLAECYECSHKYSMDFHIIPAHNPLNRLEMPTWYAEDTKKFYKMIAEQMLDSHRSKKPLVIICETHQDVELLHKAIAANKELSEIAVQVLTGSDPLQEEKMIAAAGTPGMVTISTAMISRGTDIQLQSPENGLRVLQTFLSKERIKVQVKGRAGRQGHAGEYGMLLNVAKYQQEFPQLAKMQHRYFRKNTDVFDNLWDNRSSQEMLTRQRQECIGDIRNILNQQLCLLKRERIKLGNPFSDEEERNWYTLLVDFDKKCTDLANSQHELHAQLTELVDWSASRWETYWSQQSPEQQKNLSTNTRNFYQHYANYIKQEDSHWYGLSKDDAADFDFTIPFVLDDKGRADFSKTQTAFVNKAKDWIEYLKNKAKNKVQEIKKEITTSYAESKPAVYVAKAQKLVDDCFTALKYDRNLDGYAKVYSGLFCDTRALLTGQRPLFANFRAWLNGHGTLFADTRAVLAGVRPIFANLRMTWQAYKVDKVLKEIDKFAEQASDEVLLQLNEVKKHCVSMKNRFFDHKELKSLEGQVKRLKP